jgi:hypothetical protein
VSREQSFWKVRVWDSAGKVSDKRTVTSQFTKQGVDWRPFSIGLGINIEPSEPAEKNDSDRFLPFCRLQKIAARLNYFQRPNNICHKQTFDSFVPHRIVDWNIS